MQLEKVIDDFRQRKLQIDFLEMELIQNKPGPNAVVYRGAGYVRQTEDDVLTFRLYANEVINIDLKKSFDVWQAVTPGRLYDETDYYTLKGLASDGTSWTAEQVLPHADWLASHRKPVAHGRLRSCIRSHERATPRALALYFFEKADLPCMIPKTSVLAQGCTFEIEYDDDIFAVRVKSEQPLPEYFDTRIEEALRFLLAQSVQTRVRAQGRQLELYSGIARSARTALGPPISRGSSAFMDNSWQLFDCYLDHIIRETRAAYWNPISNHVHNALEASSNSVDAWAIGLGVAVEGTASLLAYKLPGDQKAKMKELQKFIAKQVKDSDTHKQHGERVQSLVAGLTSVRAIDKMHWLVKQGGTTETHVRAWRDLRNRNVHPTGKIDVAPLDYQRLIDDLHAVSVLLYHIVFYIIGYKGSYTDYGAHGFPKAEYPPQAPVTQDPVQNLAGDDNKAESVEGPSSSGSIVTWLVSLITKLRYLLPCWRAADSARS